ncbi:hypothetical protein D9619_010933 [Psilocybe cf. subviscida]|uniref:Uncharacterized protein n=1 Tax=Psilocybe cf. subviscida TaxID=2480587 RepID=A0A8H5B8V4_9AGAR|nr:hypothetical protein D9619_010933 [Psilocybe cf. subviscida]
MSSLFNAIEAISSSSFSIDSLFDAPGTSDETRYNIRTSNSNDLHDQSRGSRNVSNSPHNSAASLVHPATGLPHTTFSAPSENTAQSRPHRAWEAGYQSPFAQTLYHPIQPSPTPPSSLRPSPLAEGPSTSQRSEGMPQRTSSYRPRIRKVVTKEITLNDNDVSAMVTLGLSPFMVNQDPIANQNRFVRNECILARQFLQLRRVTADADVRHSQTERDIYNHLGQHKAALNQVANESGPVTWTSDRTGPHSARTDPDFLALEKAHQETCARLDALSRQVAEYSRSMHLALNDLTQRLEQIIHTGAYLANPEANPRSPTATASLSPLLLSANASNLRRRWDSSGDSILESPSTLPPPTPEFRNQHLSRPQ